MADGSSSVSLERRPGGFVRTSSTWEADAKIGECTERAFFDAFHKHPPVGWPRWLERIDHATALEDSDGIDAWAVTDCGRVPIQIKSSREGVHKFRDTHPCTWVLVIIVYCTETPEQIRSKLFKALEGKYRRLHHQFKRERERARWT